MNGKLDYGATKAALRSFARTWTDLKDRGTRANAVSPGYIETPGFNHWLSSPGNGGQQDGMGTHAIPLVRFGTADEIAKALVSLASDDSSYVAGAKCLSTAA